MRPEPEPQPLIVDLAVGSRVLRQVGPAAWTVLEALAARTTPTGRGHRTRTNVRDLAVAIGISKDTVARGINKLIDARIITRSDFAQDEAGRFATRTYAVDLDKAGLRVLLPPAESGPRNQDKEDGPSLGFPSERPALAPSAPPAPRPPARPGPPLRSPGVPHGGRERPLPRVVGEGGPLARIDDAQPALFGDP